MKKLDITVQFTVDVDDDTTFDDLDIAVVTDMLRSAEQSDIVDFWDTDDSAPIK